MFCCGKFGCEVVEIDKDSDSFAARNMKKQNWLHHQKTGEFMTMDEQCDIYAEYYERHQNIKLT